MGRGIFFGAFWGFLIGALVLAVASLLGEVPGRGAPEAGVMEVPAGSGFDQAGVDQPVELAPVPSSSEPVSDAPLVTAPEAPVAPTLGGGVTTSAAVPETGGVTALAPPPEGASDSGVDLRAEEAPEGEAGEAMAVPVEDAAPETETAPAAPVEVVEEAPEPVEEVAEPVEEVAEPVEEAAEVAGEPAEEVVEAAPAEDEAPVEPVDEVAEDTAPAVVPEASTGGFGNRAEGVTVNRLTDSEILAEEEAALAESAAAAAEAEARAAEPRAILRNARTADWGGADDRPYFSLVLIDQAGDGALLGALASFEGPLTFALPATATEEARQRYRDAGHEVAIIADLPAGARPADIEVAMEASLRAVPDAVAVLDGTFSGFRGDRRVAGQVAEILSTTGHGLVTFSQGLDTASQLASRAGVPTATVFRDLDENGQGNAVIRRFLDQAAFRAQQDGSAVLLARMRPETISALLIWHQQDRAERVNIAPLSATLLAG